MIQELRRKTPKAQSSQESLSRAHLNVETEDQVITKVLNVFNEHQLTAHQAKALQFLNRQLPVSPSNPPRLTVLNHSFLILLRWSSAARKVYDLSPIVELIAEEETGKSLEWRLDDEYAYHRLCRWACSATHQRTASSLLPSVWITPSHHGHLESWGLLRLRLCCLCEPSASRPRDRDSQWRGASRKAHQSLRQDFSESRGGYLQLQ